MSNNSPETIKQKKPTNNEGTTGGIRFSDDINNDGDGGGSPKKPTTINEQRAKYKRQESVADKMKRRSTVHFTSGGGFVGDLSTSQGEALNKVKELIKDEPYPEKDGETGNFKLDDATLLRFLRARNFNVHKSVAMIKEHLQFRMKWKPHEISEREPLIKEFLDCGFWSIPGKTKDGHPFELLRASKYDPKRYTVEDFTRCIIYTRERVAGMIADISGEYQKADQGEFMLRERTMLLVDASQWSFFKQGTPLGMSQTRALVDLLSIHYPETLGVACILFAPSTFKWAFAIIKRWMDEETASRISFVSNYEELHELIDPSILSTKYGGTIEPTPEEEALAATSGRRTMFGGGGGGRSTTVAKGGDNNNPGIGRRTIASIRYSRQPKKTDSIKSSPTSKTVSVPEEQAVKVIEGGGGEA